MTWDHPSAFITKVSSVRSLLFNIDLKAYFLRLFRYKTSISFLVPIILSVHIFLGPCFWLVDTNYPAAYNASIIMKFQYLPLYFFTSTFSFENWHFYQDDLNHFIRKFVSIIHSSHEYFIELRHIWYAILIVFV